MILNLCKTVFTNDRFVGDMQKNFYQNPLYVNASDKKAILSDRYDKCDSQLGSKKAKTVKKITRY